MAHQQPRVAVIGAGAGGLAAALTLARAGLRVTVYEKHTSLGGKIGREEHEGVTFDTGPSVLTMPDVLNRLLGPKQETLRDHVNLRALGSSFRYIFPDGLHLDISDDPELTLAEVHRKLGPKSESQMRHFLSYAKRIWEITNPVFIFGDAPSARGVLNLGLRKLLSVGKIDATRSMWRSICAQIDDPHLRALLARYATYNGSDVRKAPGTLNCIAHVELGMGGHGVEGGMYRLVEGLVSMASRLPQPVEFRTGSPVTSLTIRSGQIKGITLESGEAIAADFVVCNADAKHLYQELLERRPPSGEPSMSGWTGVIRARLTPQRSAHAVIFPEDYTQEFADIFDRGARPTHPTVYACDQSLAHGVSGWEDSSPLFVMVNAPNVRAARGSTDWSYLSEQVHRTLQKHDLIADDDPFLWSRQPQELANRFPGSDGSLYGPASNTMLSAFQRPPNRVKEAKGLYLASGSAHPGGGVPLCLLSGLAASRALIQDLKHRPHQASL